MHQVGDLFELNVKLWCQKVKELTVYVKKTELDMSLKLMTNGWAFRIPILAEKGIFLCASTSKTCLEHRGLLPLGKAFGVVKVTVSLHIRVHTTKQRDISLPLYPDMFTEWYLAPNIYSHLH